MGQRGGVGLPVLFLQEVSEGLARRLCGVDVALSAGEASLPIRLVPDPLLQPLELGGEIRSRLRGTGSRPKGGQEVRQPTAGLTQLLLPLPAVPGELRGPLIVLERRPSAPGEASVPLEEEDEADPQGGGTDQW